MKNLALSLPVLLLVVFGFFTFWNRLNPQWLPVVLSEDGPTYRIEGKYPQIGISAIDDQIKKSVDNASAEIKSLPANPSDSATPKNLLTFAFDRPYVGQDIVSVRLIISQDTGGAHPLTLLSGLNFDRGTARKLELKDALEYIGKTVREVSEKSTAQFQSAFRDGFFPEGADSNPENYSSFLFTENSVGFMFQQYQVAAYANGPQEVIFKRVK